jgi:tetratricopeptide (TPR) repeat protein
MNPSDVRLDALGFPLPYGFDDLPSRAAKSTDPQAPVPSRKRARGTFTIRLMLVMVAVGAGVMALVRAELTEPVSKAVAEWLASHATDKHAADDLDGALRDLDRALAWSDKSPAIFAMRGQVRLEKGDVVGSLADFNKLVSLVPHSSRAYVLRSASLQRLERHEDAIRDVSQAVQLHSSDGNLLNARAYTRAIAGQELDQALADIEEAIRLEGENSHYLDTQGYIRYLMGQHDRALADLDRALAIDQDDVLPGFLLSGHPHRARMLAREKRLNEQNLAVMYHHRGQIHEALGNLEQAQSDLRRGDALGYNPAAGVY